jgi:hypothetical protein
MAKQRGYRIPRSFTGGRVVCWRKVTALGRSKLLRIPIGRLQATIPQKAVNEGTCFNKPSTHLTTNAFSDEERLVVTDALPASRDPEQGLVRQSLVESFDELLDCLGLVPGGRVVRFELKRVLFHA